MTVHKRYTNKNKTKFTWGYVATVPSNQFDRFGNPKRKQITKSGFETKKEAQQAEKELLENYEKGKVELSKNVVFSDVYNFFVDYMESIGQYSKGTIANYKCLYENHLTMFHNVRVDKITQTLIRAWKKEISSKNVSVYRINDCIKLLKAIFNYAKSEKQITSNPFEELKKLPESIKLRKRFSLEQLKKLISSCENLLPEYYCMFSLSCLTGMRVGEYSALKVNDFDFENGQIYVEKQFTRGEEKNKNKTIKSTRIVHVSKQLLSIVKWHIDKFNIKEGLLFKDTTGRKPVSAKWISRKFRKLLTLNGYDENFCRVHDLRGQFVDIMHYLGVTTEYIAREVGHSNVTTTSKIYTQILNEVHTEANNKMDNILFNNQEK